MEPGPVSPAARALFDRLADLPREQWDGVLEVEHKSGMSPADIAAVRALLQDLPVSVRPEGTRAGAAMRGLRQRIEAATALAYPKQVGPYRILEQIGRGGYATVFRAEQEVPIRRTVAVKFLHPSHLIDDVVARFRLEQQALASLEHPNIARIIDAGQSELGIPYFVMEYVPGPPVTEYADRKKLTIRERLELFEQVCRGVLHAHQRGLIHRDLKPSNILVAEVDGRPIAKVIDFGIAKALAGEGRGAPTGEQAAQTLGDTPLGTLAYMSPEQAQARPDADVRTDVFGLGVVLYELLVGVTPLDPVQLESAWASGGPLSALGLVCQADSPRPSSRLRELRERGGDKAPNSAAGRGTPTVADTVAAERGTTADALQRLMQSELEWIPLKALEKERERRYASVGELAEDVRRYLDRRPIAAHPPSWRYRTGKFARRRPGLVWGSVAAAAMVVGSLIAIAIFAAGERTMRIDRDKQLALNQEQLAKSRYDAATLASQRGEWKAALAHIDDARELGHPDSVGLDLFQIQALDALERTEEAKPILAALAKRGDQGSHRGEVLLWQGDLLLAGYIVPGVEKAGEELLRDALDSGQLTGADAAYARGLLERDLVSARTALVEAVESNPFHLRAQMVLGLVEVLLLMPESALTRTRFAKLRAAEAAAPHVLESLAYLVLDDQPAALAAIDRAGQRATPKAAKLMRSTIEEISRVMKAAENGQTIGMPDAVALAGRTLLAVKDQLKSGGIRAPASIREFLGNPMPRLARVVFDSKGAYADLHKAIGPLFLPVDVLANGMPDAVAKSQYAAADGMINEVLAMRHPFVRGKGRSPFLYSRFMSRMGLLLINGDKSARTVALEAAIWVVNEWDPEDGQYDVSNMAKGMLKLDAPELARQFLERITRENGKRARIPANLLAWACAEYELGNYSGCAALAAECMNVAGAKETAPARELFAKAKQRLGHIGRGDDSKPIEEWLRTQLSADPAAAVAP